MSHPATINAKITPMATPHFNLLDPHTPLVFADGSAMYQQLGQRYRQHARGYFILAPSGAGKTHFVERQTEPHWLDGDELWCLANAHPAGSWWLDGIETIMEIDRRCDVITAQAKKLGFWIVGASNVWLKPDAIVLPHWSTHKRYITHREHHNYDGGATTAQLKGVLNHRRWIDKWAKQGVPKFHSVAEAAAHLASQAQPTSVVAGTAGPRS